MNAFICDKQYVRQSDAIAGDASGYLVAEAQAYRMAARDRKDYCVMLEGGGFWSPNGRTALPYWYEPLAVVSRQRAVYLSDVEYEMAKSLGDGNFSEGVRRAIAKANS